MSYSHKENVLKGLRDYILTEQEADLVGFAPVERFKEAPHGHGPQDYLPHARSVIVFGYKVNDAIVDSTEYSPSMIPPDRRKMAIVRTLYYRMGHLVQDGLLDTAAYKIAKKLERNGFKTIPMPCTHPGNELRLVGYFGLFSHRHAAVRAGLGEFGLNNLVINPRFGPRVRYNSIITTAELNYDPLISEKVCLGKSCQKCLESCPALSIKEDINLEEISLSPPAVTDKKKCRPTMFAGLPSMEPNAGCGFYGMCLRSCPIGT